MAIARLQRQISRLLGEAEKAVQRRDWKKVMDSAQDALVLDPANRDAWGLLAAAKRAPGLTGMTHAPSAAKFPHDAPDVPE